MRDNDPKSWARAVEVDESLRSGNAIASRHLNETMYIHRSCKPLKDAPIESPESSGEQYVFGFHSECEGMCGN
jgi:hypothetical protein